MIDLDARRDVAERLEVAEELTEQPAGSGLDDMTRAKLRYLETLGVARLVADGKGMLNSLADTRGRINILKAGHRNRAGDLRVRIAKAKEIAALAEAALMGSEAFAALKNEAQRKGWLLSQRTEDLNWCQALRVVEHFERELAEAELAFERELADAEASHETLGRDYQLCLAELRTAESTLRFLAGQ